MFRIWIEVDAPGRPSLWRLFMPATLPTNVPDVVDARDLEMSPSPTLEIAPVSDSFRCVVPKPSTTTSLKLSTSSFRVTFMTVRPFTAMV